MTTARRKHVHSSTLAVMLLFVSLWMSAAIPAAGGIAHGSETATSTFKRGNLCDGADTSLSNQIVTAVFTDHAYVQDPERSAGFGLETTTALAVGDRVSLSGAITTRNGERVIVANLCQVIAHDCTIPKPLGMSARCVGGPSVGASGPDNGGLLVRLWGRVTYCEPDSAFVYVDDGSALNDGNILGTGGRAVTGLRVALSPGVPFLPEGSYIAVTGISACGLVEGRLARLLRARFVGDLQIVKYATPQLPPTIKFAIINPAGDDMLLPMVMAQLSRLGVQYVDARCDSDGNIQPLTGADAAFEGTLDGVVIINSTLSEAIETQLAMNKMHAFKMLNLAYSHARKTMICNTGISAAAADSTLLYVTVPQRAYTRIADSEAESIQGYFGLWGKGDGVTPITKLLYLKFDGSERHVAWEVNATGNMFALVSRARSTGAVDLVNIIIGLYINRLNKVSRTRALPLYINIDDANAGLSAQCVDNVAAALRESGGMIPAGWGSDCLIAGGINPASPEPAASVFAAHPNYPETATSWRNALDVIPQILHDHVRLPGQSRPILQQTWPPEQVSAALDSRLAEAQNWAGLPLELGVGRFSFVAWNCISDNGLIALAQRGTGIFRSIYTETGAARPAEVSLTDGMGAAYTVRNVAASSAGSGEFREALGSKLMTAIRWTGLTVADQTAGKVFYFHGPQFATNNAGGIRRHGASAMEAGDAIIVNGVAYTWVTSGAQGNQFNVSGNIATDMSNLAAKLATDLVGIAAVTVVNDGGTYSVPSNSNNVEIVPIDPSATITVDCNETAARKIAPMSCVLCDVALEILDSNFTNLTVLAPMYRIASYNDWQALR